MWTHEQSYKGVGLRARIHRARLATLARVFEGIPLGPQGVLADFGCSNGYVLSQLQARFFEGRAWGFHGFDHAEALLADGRAKGLPRTTFHVVDMTRRLPEWDRAFDVTICLETLEHTSDSVEGLLTLHQVTRPGGHILVSIPNERGVQGLVKLVARPLVYTDPYGDFFAERSRARYVWNLLTGRRIDVFRDHRPEGWGPHLGFDWKVFEEAMEERLLAPGLCRLVRRETSAFELGIFYLLERVG